MRELGERLALGYQFHIASSREQPIREAAPHYEENMKMFGELRLVRALIDEQIEAMRDPRLVGWTESLLPTPIPDVRRAPGRSGDGNQAAALLPSADFWCSPTVLPTSSARTSSSTAAGSITSIFD